MVETLPSAHRSQNPACRLGLLAAEHGQLHGQGDIVTNTVAAQLVVADVQPVALFLPQAEAGIPSTPGLAEWIFPARLNKFALVVLAWRLWQ